MRLISNFSLLGHVSWQSVRRRIICKFLFWSSKIFLNEFKHLSCSTHLFLFARFFSTISIKLLNLQRTCPIITTHCYVMSNRKLMVTYPPEKLFNLPQFLANDHKAILENKVLRTVSLHS